MKPTTGATVMGFDLLSEWSARGTYSVPSATLGSSVRDSSRDRTPRHFRSSCPPALTPEVVSMSNDNGSEPRRRVSWLGVASLLVAVTRLVLDFWRKD